MLIRWWKLYAVGCFLSPKTISWFLYRVWQCRKNVYSLQMRKLSHIFRFCNRTSKKEGKRDKWKSNSKWEILHQYVFLSLISGIKNHIFKSEKEVWEGFSSSPHFLSTQFTNSYSLSPFCYKLNPFLIYARFIWIVVHYSNIGCIQVSLLFVGSISTLIPLNINLFDYWVLFMIRNLIL